MSTEDNKKVVIRFNREFLQTGNKEVLDELVDDAFINHTAVGNFPKDKSGLVQFVDMFHKGFSNLHIEIHTQVAENDMVATHKTIQAVHTGEIMGHEATGKNVTMSVIDIIRIKDGKYIDHWGRNDIMQVIQQL
jgi:predicted ester cyclase